MSPSSSDKDYKAQELIDEALLDYHYYMQRMNGASTYNASVGRYLDKDYFVENPIKCAFQAAGCMHRFKTYDEMTNHRYRTHGA